MNTQRSIGGSAKRQGDVDAARERLNRARPRHGSQRRTGGAKTHPPGVSWRQNQDMQLSPFGVNATAGSLRVPGGVGLHHQWTEEGVMASPVVNGAQVLHLSVALCVLNDTYREAERLGVMLEGVAVQADGSFDAEWR